MMEQIWRKLQQQTQDRGDGLVQHYRSFNGVRGGLRGCSPNTGARLLHMVPMPEAKVCIKWLVPTYCLHKVVSLSDLPRPLHVTVITYNILHKLIVMCDVCILWTQELCLWGHYDMCKLINRKKGLSSFFFLYCKCNIQQQWPQSCCRAATATTYY